MYVGLVIPLAALIFFVTQNETHVMKSTGYDIQLGILKYLNLY